MAPKVFENIAAAIKQNAATDEFDPAFGPTVLVMAVSEVSHALSEIDGQPPVEDVLLEVQQLSEADCCLADIWAPAQAMPTLANGALIDDPLSWG